MREEVAAQLAGLLAEPHATALALSHVSAEAKRAWAALCAAGGHMKVTAFTRRVRRDPARSGRVSSSES